MGTAHSNKCQAMDLRLDNRATMPELMYFRIEIHIRTGEEGTHFPQLSVDMLTETALASNASPKAEDPEAVVMNFDDFNLTELAVAEHITSPAKGKLSWAQINGGHDQPCSAEAARSCSLAQ